MKNMNKIALSILAVLLFGFLSCKNRTSLKQEENLVKIGTSYGDIIVRLYDETPVHRDNFIKLVNEGFYNGLLFHRVIKNFMIQGGDPDSKGAPAGKQLGEKDAGYTLPAEIRPQLFHKRGALAAAREPDQNNPEERSSGSQFYIVEGKVFTPSELDTLEQEINQKRMMEINRKVLLQHQQELVRLSQDKEKFNTRMAEIREEADKEISNMKPYKIDEAKRKIYTTIGGYPSLDMNYTVFGEVVKGMDIVDKIASAETDQYDRPKKNIKMKVKIIN